MDPKDALIESLKQQRNLAHDQLADFVSRANVALFDREAEITDLKKQIEEKLSNS